MSRFTLPTRRRTIELARKLAPLLRSGDLVVLDGELGAGKTFFTRALGRALGLPERIRVTSPTFSLVHEYQTRLPLYHADLYRLEAERDVHELGLLEAREDGALLVVEWGKPWIVQLGNDALVVTFTTEPRTAELVATGPRSSEILRELTASD